MVAKIYPEIIACIYSIKTPSGIYIGRAEHFYSRIAGHYKHLRLGNHHNTRLQQEHNDYGCDCFTTTVLERIERYSENEVRALEKEYMRFIPHEKLLNSIDGYSAIPAHRIA